MKQKRDSLQDSRQFSHQLFSSRLMSHHLLHLRLAQQVIQLIVCKLPPPLTSIQDDRRRALDAVCKMVFTSLVPRPSHAFNDSCENSGRLGRSGDIMDAVWAVVSLTPPTLPRNILHAEKLASTVNGTVAQ